MYVRESDRLKTVVRNDKKLRELDVLRKFVRHDMKLGNSRTCTCAATLNYGTRRILSHAYRYQPHFPRLLQSLCALVRSDENYTNIVFGEVGNRAHWNDHKMITAPRNNKTKLCSSKSLHARPQGQHFDSPCHHMRTLYDDTQFTMSSRARHQDNSRLNMSSLYPRNAATR